MAIDELCAYAYAHIYNESVEYDDIPLPQTIIDSYNGLYQKATETIDEAIQRLAGDGSDIPVQSDYAIKNVEQILHIHDRIRDKLKPYLGY